MDAAPHCPGRFSPPVADIHRRESARFSAALALALEAVLGFLAGVGYALTVVGVGP